MESKLSRLMPALLSLAIIFFLSTPLYPGIIGFESYTVIKGYVHDDEDQPLPEVQVSYMDTHTYYRVFTDTCGFYELKIRIIDGPFSNKIVSKEQINICNEYIRSVGGCCSFKEDKELKNKLSENLFNRKVLILYNKLGYDEVKLDTVLLCRMKDENLKTNMIYSIKLARNQAHISNTDSKTYFSNKIIYNNIDYWYFYKGTRRYTTSETDHGFELIKEVDKRYVSKKLLKIGIRAKNYSNIGFYSSVSGICIGILGAAITKGSNRLYPASAGLITLFSGWYLQSKSRKMKKEFIIKYNEDLDKIFLNTN